MKTFEPKRFLAHRNAPVEHVSRGKPRRTQDATVVGLLSAIVRAVSATSTSRTDNPREAP
jgi:hypothetical protein